MFVRILCLLLSLFFFNPVKSYATYTVLHNFTDSSTDGIEPYGSPLLYDGVLYGMTYEAGANGAGCIFSYDPTGSVFTILHSFASGADGGYPYGNGLIADSNGVLYGMTYYEGTGNGGCIFSFDTQSSTYTVLVSFTGDAGDYPGFYPVGSLLLYDDVLYGMTSEGGTNDYGVLFSVNTNGSDYTVLYDFDSSSGEYPYGSLIEVDGIFYGTASEGGSGYGCVFSFDPTGLVYTVVVNFTGDTGSYPGGAPYGSLLFYHDLLYGMTYVGGSTEDSGCVFSVKPDGSDYTVLVNFLTTGVTGYYPYGSLTVSDGILYGMTSEGGANEYGCIFSFNPTGSVYTDLIDFTGETGDYPGGKPYYGALVVDGSLLYGMTYEGGPSDDGVLFSLTNPTPPLSASTTLPSPCFKQITPCNPGKRVFR